MLFKGGAVEIATHIIAGRSTDCMDEPSYDRRCVEAMREYIAQLGPAVDWKWTNDDPYDSSYSCTLSVPGKHGVEDCHDVNILVKGTSFFIFGSLGDEIPPVKLAGVMYISQDIEHREFYKSLVARREELIKCERESLLESLLRQTKRE